MDPTTQLFASVFGTAAKAATPGGPSSSASDPFFGSVLSNFDAANWIVNFGNGNSNTADQTKGGPNQTNDPTKVTNGGAIIPQNTNGLPLTNGAASVSGLPWMLILGGAAVLLLIWKKA